MLIEAALPAATPAPPPLKVEIPRPDKRRRLIDEFFNGPIVRLKIEFTPEEWEYLKRDHRRYAECILRETGPDGKEKVYKGVGVKLKGTAGSFRGPDDKPGLTLSFSKFKGADRFHGMSRFHLNNGAQDGTFLHEAIAGEMARKAGVPASRCTHAIVTLNGREHGLYVFKEAFTDEFLTRFFEKTDGALYDGGNVADIREDMEKDEGDPKDRADIKELIAACQEQDPAKRWARLEKILDIDRFLSHLAMEAAVCHWDGYDFNRNNYRIYFDPGTGKAHFFLHGMDQTFGDANSGPVRDSGAMVGQAVLSNPVWKAAYRERAQQIYEQVLKPHDWAARVVEIGEKARAALAAVKPEWGKDYQNRIGEARSRIEGRVVGIGKQLGDMPKPFKFDAQGIAKLDRAGWRIEGPSPASEAQVDGRPALHIRAAGAGVGSWRRSVTLDPGRYRFEGKLRTAGVQAAQSESGEGAGLRISGATRNGQNAAGGDTPWKHVWFDFDAPGGDVVLVAELRATQGDAWFERDGFVLRRVK